MTHFEQRSFLVFGNTALCLAKTLFRYLTPLTPGEGRVSHTLGSRG